MTSAPSRSVVALVGLGNIGFRHLQGLKSIADRVRLIGVDIVPDNLARAAAEWPGADAVFTSGAEAPDHADALILATSAQGRLALLRAWGDRLAPRFVLLEKVTFTRPADFEAAAQWAATRGAHVHVNCPRRLWPSFHRLRAALAQTSGPIEVSLVDPDLGLACNGVHLIDAFQFLTGEADVRLASARIEAIVEARRPGYKEAIGTIDVTTPAGARLSLVVRPGEDGDRRLRARRGGLTLSLDQAKGRMETGDGDVQEWGRAPYQSELTGVVVGRFLDEGRCDLPDLATAALAHGPMIEALRAPLESAGAPAGAELPIT